MQNCVVLVGTGSEAHTKLFWEPVFGDAAAVQFTIQEEVKRAILSFDHLKNSVLL